MVDYLLQQWMPAKLPVEALIYTADRRSNFVAIRSKAAYIGACLGGDGWPLRPHYTCLLRRIRRPGKAPMVRRAHHVVERNGQHWV